MKDYSSLHYNLAKNDLILQLFDEGYRIDPFPSEVLEMLRQNKRHSKDISLAECTEIDKRLFYRGCLYVPNHDPLKLEILKSYHDAASAGHAGREKTFELISRDYYWPSMRNYIGKYVRNCYICQRSKPSNHKKFGVLRPLPRSQEFDAIMVVVDRLTKMRHLIPCHTTATSQEVASLYLQNVWKLHGLPYYITSDRGTQFTAHFWKNLCNHLGIKARMSTAS